jgi:hypothetical protein
MNSQEDQFTLAPGGNRMSVDVTFQLSRTDVYRAFIFYAGYLRISRNPKVLPPTRDLLYSLHQILWLYGHEYSSHEVQREPDQEIREFADRATRRVWNSRLVKVARPKLARPGTPDPS